MLGVKILEWKAHGYLYGLEWQDITIILALSAPQNQHQLSTSKNWVLLAGPKNKSAHGMLVP